MKTIFTIVGLFVSLFAIWVYSLVHTAAVRQDTTRPQAQSVPASSAFNMFEKPVGTEVLVSAEPISSDGTRIIVSNVSDRRLYFAYLPSRDEGAETVEYFPVITEKRHEGTGFQIIDG